MEQISKTSIISTLLQKLQFLKFVALVNEYGTGSTN